MVGYLNLKTSVFDVDLPLRTGRRRRDRWRSAVDPERTFAELGAYLNSLGQPRLAEAVNDLVNTRVSPVSADRVPDGVDGEIWLSLSHFGKHVASFLQSAQLT